MGLLHLALVVLQEQAHGAMEHPHPAFGDGGGMASRGHALTGGFHAQEPHRGVLHKRVKQPHRIGAAAHTGHQHIGQAPKGLRTLAFGFLANHGVKIPHQHRVGMGARHGAQDVVGAFHVGHPIANGLTGGVLEGGAAGRHRLHRGSEQTHPKDVEGLAAHVFCAHVDHAVQTEAGAHGGRGHPVLASAGFGNDPLFAHAQGQQGLAEGVVDLVGTGVVEVLTLQPNAGAALGPGVMGAEPLRLVKGGRPAHISAKQVVEAVGEGRILPSLRGRHLELRQGRHQGFRHVLPPKLAKAPGTRGARRRLQGCRIQERRIQGRRVGRNRAGHRRHCGLIDARVRT